MRELAWMAEGRQRSAWQQTSAVLAMLVNVNKSKGSAAKPSEFDPFAEEERRQRKQHVSVLRDVFNV